MTGDSRIQPMFEEQRLALWCIQNPDKAAASIEELGAALRDVIESDALTTFEGCECKSCAPIMRGRDLLARLGSAARAKQERGA